MSEQTLNRLLTREDRVADWKERLELAKLITQPDAGGQYHAHLLTPENEKFGTVPLAIAVEMDYAFFVDVKRSILALDFDFSEGVNVAESMIQRQGLQGRAIVCLSGGGQGRAHLFVKVNGRAEKERLAEDARRAAKAYTRENPVRQAIRPPLTLHRSGLSSSHLHKISIPNAIKNLTLSNVAREVANRLSTGWAKGERSEGLLWLAGQYGRDGLTLERYKRDVLTSPHGAGEKIQNRPSHEQERYLERTWQRAQETNFTKGARGAVTEWVAHALLTVGLNSKLTNTVCEIHRVAMVANTTEPTLSVRTFETNGKGTTSKHLKELRERGLLEIVNPWGGDRATVYKLKTPDAKEIEHLKQSLGGGVLTQLFGNLRMMEALHHKRSAVRVMLALLIHPGKSAKELADVMKLHKRTVELQLRWLREMDLANQRGGQYFANVDPVNAERVATRRGTLGIRQTIRERYEQERKAFHLARILREQEREARRRWRTLKQTNDQGSRAMLM